MVLVSMVVFKLSNAWGSCLQDSIAAFDALSVCCRLLGKLRVFVFKL